jgi:hypothetical protein
LKKEIEGWLDIRWDDTAIYDTKEKFERGYPFDEKITEQLEEFHGKKVRLIIEVIK